MQHVKAGTAALITAIRPGNLECVWRPPGGAVRLALLVLAGWGLAGQQSSAAPVNDNFANRIVLSGTDIHRTGSNVGATTEPGEPAGNENTVWYSWTAPANGFATVQADFHKIALVTPTRLPTAVYTGSSLANLTLAPIQASNTFHSDYIFPTVAGRAYQIAVQTPTEQTDQFDFSLFTGPVALNDNFANSTLLAGAPAAVKAIVLNSSTEPGEPTPCYPGSLWWSWTAPRSGRAVFTTLVPSECINLYTGSTVSALTPIELGDVAGGGLLLWEVTAGVTYGIRYSHLFQADYLEFGLNVYTAPVNDSFNAASVLPGTNTTVTGTTFGATREPGEPLHGQTAGRNSVWWRWTAPVAGRALLSTEGSDFDSVLSVYRGLSVSNLTWVASDDNSGSNSTSRLVFDAQAGDSFQIAVSGYLDEYSPNASSPFRSQGNVLLHLEMVPLPAPSTTVPAALPNVKLSKEGLVSITAVQPDGKVIIGGVFSAVNGQDRKNIARLNESGSLDQTWTPETDGKVDRVWVSGSDVFLAGAFQSVNGVRRSGLAKVSLLSGAVDRDWDPNPDGPILSLAAANGNVFVAGRFTSIGGQTRTNLAKIPQAGNGRLDLLWNPAQGQDVYALLAYGDKLIAATMQPPYLAKLEQGGAGVRVAGWNPQPPDLNHSLFRVEAMLIQGTNLVVAGPHPRLVDSEVFRVPLADGGNIDPNWRFSCCDFLNNDQFTAMVLVGDRLCLSVRLGTPRIGPAFRLYNLDVATASPTPWPVPTIESPTYESDAGHLDFGDGRVSVDALAVKGNQLLVAGNFSSVDGIPALCVAAVDPISGALDRSFSAHAERPGIVLAMTRQPDGKTVIGGEFAFVGTIPRGNVARFNADGTLDPAWFPNPNGAVTALRSSDSALFVGGLFTDISGVPRRYIAKLPLTGGSSPDPAWDAPVFERAFTSQPRWYPVRDIAVVRDKVFIAGSGTNSTFDFAILDGTTGQVEFTDPAPAAFVLAQPDGKVVVVGPFGSFAGGSRDGLARVSGTPPYSLDAQWIPRLRSIYNLCAAALGPNHLYVALRSVRSETIVKVELGGSGLEASDWASAPLFYDKTGSGEQNMGVRALAVAGPDLYVGGLFWPIGFPTPPAGGPGKAFLARLDAGTGATKAVWSTGKETASLVGGGFYDPAADSTVRRLLAVGNDLFVGGDFSQLSGESRFGFALLARPDAPVIGQEADGRVTVLRNADDGEEVTHFQLVAVSGGGLYLADGTTPVRPGDFISISDGQAGLRFISQAPQGGATLTLVSAVAPKPQGAGTAATTFTVNVAGPPIVRFESANYRVNEGGDFIDVAVRKIGAGAATVGYTTTNGTAIGGLDFFNRSGTLSFPSASNLLSIRLRIVDDGLTEGDEVFGLLLTNVSGGAILAAPRLATITIVDNDIVGSGDSVTTTQSPAPLSLPPAVGALTVMLQPSSGQWRLIGDDSWQPSGATVSGLAPGYHEVELRALFGYQTPDDFTAAIVAGSTTRITAAYVPESQGPLTSGHLQVLVKPASVATDPVLTQRGQWRLQGEAGWRAGSAIISNLPVGYYTVEFKDVLNMATPRSWEVWVRGAQLNQIEGVYSPVAALGQEPAVLSLAQATATAPYFYNGQIQTRLGFGSGVVVKQRVVLTAAHVLFDDRLLSYADQARWFLRKHHGEYDPVPQISRGWLKWDGYAVQRQADNSPGISSPESQQLDAAAMFFVEGVADPNLPGAGGYGGFLSSDALANEWLLSERQKFLAGYPLDRVIESNRGKMHATTPQNVSFQQRYGRVFVTSDLRSYGGNSGGPLYVQADDGQYYLAGIYLGGSTETLVRAIDSEVVDLINRAELAGDNAGNATGGGVARWEAGVTTSAYIPGLFRVTFPAAALAAGAAWRVQGADDPTWIRDTNLHYPLIPGSFNIEFKTLSGYSTPHVQLMAVVVDQTTIIEAGYRTIALAPPRRLVNGAYQLDLTGGTGRVYTIQWAQAPGNWTDLLTVTNVTGATSTSDSSTTTRRFYRAVERGQ